MPNNDRQTSEIIAAKADIDDMLSRLQAHSDNHFGVDPDHANWADVAETNRLKAALREITDMVFQEGEHSETVRA